MVPLKKKHSSVPTELIWSKDMQIKFTYVLTSKEWIFSVPRIGVILPNAHPVVNLIWWAGIFTYISLIFCSIQN